MLDSGDLDGSRAPSERTRVAATGSSADDNDRTIEWSKRGRIPQLICLALGVFSLGA